MGDGEALASYWRQYEAEGFTQFVKKRHIFKAIGRAIMGEDKGAIFCTQWGVEYTYGAFFTSKNAIFDLDVYLSMKRRRPRPN